MRHTNRALCRANIVHFYQVITILGTHGSRYFAFWGIIKSGFKGVNGLEGGKVAQVAFVFFNGGVFGVFFGKFGKILTLFGEHTVNAQGFVKGFKGIIGRGLLGKAY